MFKNIISPFIAQGFILSFIPGFKGELDIINSIKYEIQLTENILGREKTIELVNQFKNEAFAQVGINHLYIINKLRIARTKNKI